MSTTDPDLESFVEVSKNSDFPIQNLPYGVFSEDNKKRVGVAIGDHILDLSVLQEKGIFSDIFTDNLFDKPFLNDFMAKGFDVWSAVRLRISKLLHKDNKELRDDNDLRKRALHLMSDCEMQLPVKINEFTDFYSSYNHAFNVGSLIRGPENAMMPNWKHLPVAYHGRASSVIPSGVPIVRPNGQTKSPDSEYPEFGPTKRLDFELEMGFFVGTPNEMGKPIPIKDAYKHIFGMVLVNDWSGRDIQVWEYRPLGPFLAKNFATSISPWVVTMEALEPFRKSGEEQDPKPLPYLNLEGRNAYDIHLQVSIQSERMNEPNVISNSNATHLYWNIFQQLAHHSVNGCNMRTGDLLGSGTISGKEMDSRGCLLEMTLLGKQEIKISEDETRVFLEDGDTIILSGHCKANNYRVGFGKVETKIQPAPSFP